MGKTACQRGAGRSQLEGVGYTVAAPVGQHTRQPIAERVRRRVAHGIQFVEAHPLAVWGHRHKQADRIDLIHDALLPRFKRPDLHGGSGRHIPQKSGNQGIQPKLLRLVKRPQFAEGPNLDSGRLRPAFLRGKRSKVQSGQVKNTAPRPVMLAVAVRLEHR
ncbi:MAG: hypothetical protein JWQ08_2500 [Deinococcus sp.]|nr:hypothetical protein [Deinococcus sp.]